MPDHSTHNTGINSVVKKYVHISLKARVDYLSQAYFPSINGVYFQKNNEWLALNKLSSVGLPEIYAYADMSWDFRLSISDLAVFFK